MTIAVSLPYSLLITNGGIIMVLSFHKSMIVIHNEDFAFCL